MSDSMSMSILVRVTPRCWAMAWMPTEMQAARAAWATSVGLAAESSPSSLTGSPTLTTWPRTSVLLRNRPSASVWVRIFLWPPSGLSMFFCASSLSASVSIGSIGSPAVWFGVRSDMKLSLMSIFILPVSIIFFTKNGQGCLFYENHFVPNTAGGSLSDTEY